MCWLYLRCKGIPLGWSSPDEDTGHGLFGKVDTMENGRW